jgi:CubicO group peptidase (beta-lactamase class C family)
MSRSGQSSRSAFVPLLSLTFSLMAACGSPPTLPEQLAAISAEAHAAGDLNGNVLIARDGEVLHEASFGTANAGSKVANTSGSRFLIASISKPFTAVLILQLMEQGKLSADSRLDAIAPSLANSRAGGITIHQLLTHTSGIDEVISRDPSKRIAFGDLVSAKVGSPGKFAYSNTGFVCLALIVERLTGGTFEAALDSGILTPANMRDSGVLRSNRTPDNLSVGHRGQTELEVAKLDFAPEAVDGAGSIYSTARDLFAFDRALLAGKLLKPETLALMHRQQVPGRFGYGWFLSEQGGAYYPWHAGDMAGYSASLARQIHRDEVVIVLANGAATDARELQRQYLKVLKARPRSIAPALR